MILSTVDVVPHIAFFAMSGSWPVPSGPCCANEGGTTEQPVQGWHMAQRGSNRITMGFSFVSIPSGRWRFDRHRRCDHASIQRGSGLTIAAEWLATRSGGLAPPRAENA